MKDRAQTVLNFLANALVVHKYRYHEFIRITNEEFPSQDMQDVMAELLHHLNAGKNLHWIAEKFYRKRKNRMFVLLAEGLRNSLYWHKQ